MKSEEFWQFYEPLRPKLGFRSNGFARIFEHLDSFDRPVGIVETGCTRNADNWSGDGGSTRLFDHYAETHPGSVVYSVDLDAKATELCRSLVSDRVRIHTGDSVKFLQGLADRRPTDLPFVDLLYLDSFDVNFNDTSPSALHHIKELIASSPFIRADTLVVVDDCVVALFAVRSVDGSMSVVGPARIDGKGRYVADYARHVGAEQLMNGYQCGWVKMRTVA